MLQYKSPLRYSLLAFSYLLLVASSLHVFADSQQDQQQPGDVIGAGEKVENKLAIDLVSPGGIEVKFPYFDDETKELDPPLLELSREAAIDMVEFFRTVIRNRVGVRRGFFSSAAVNVFGTVNVLKNLKNIGDIHYRRLKPYTNNLEINKPFIEIFGGMFMLALSDSKNIDVSNDTADALKKDSELLLDAMSETFNQSPVGIYLDFQRGTVNGELFHDALANFLARLRKRGCGCLIGAVEMLVRRTCGMPEKASSELEA